MKSVVVDGVRLEYARLPSSHHRDGAPAIVFLHEGLGSASLWRDFPQRVADASGCDAIVYSRQGYGGSDPARTPRTRRYLHHEAIDVLPALLDALGLQRPFLFGHSDGATIALLCAGETATPLSGLIAAAPHVLVEDVTLEGIRRTDDAYRATDLGQRLARHHPRQDVDRVFADWRDTWLDPGFRDWNVESCLSSVRCPVLAIQGEDDEYATMAQFDHITAQLRDVTQLRLADCRHSPHKDQPQAVIDATAAFIERLVT
ncbi:MAG: alpha/beta hydrolase [Gammaproteobacteria bacterium]|nr:alpha/beta hydrolase [Gammaproteobacteria bacterium]